MDDDEQSDDIIGARFQPSIVITIGIDFAARIADATGEALDALAKVLAAHYVWKRDREQYQADVLADIERLP